MAARVELTTWFLLCMMLFGVEVITRLLLRLYTRAKVNVSCVMKSLQKLQKMQQKIKIKQILKVKLKIKLIPFI